MNDRGNEQTPKKVVNSRSQYTLAMGVKSFLGFLEGRSKSVPTIQSYHRDLKTFQKFWQKQGPTREWLPIERITIQDLIRYQDFLKAEGFKTNTRRRQLLTIRRLFRYLNKRNKTRLEVGAHLPAPYKVEKIPKIIPYETLQMFAESLPERDEVELRDKLMVRILFETGCAVRELVKMRREALRASHLTIGSRVVSVSSEISKLAAKLPPRETPYVLLGYNRFGPLSLLSPMSPRTVEFLFKSFSVKYKKILGDVPLNPRTFRHSMIVHWLRKGESESSIQTKLGLKSDYAFRVYRKLVPAKVSRA